MQILKAFLIFLTVASPVFTFKVEVISIQVYSRRFREYTQLKRRNPGMIHMKKTLFQAKAVRYGPGQAWHCQLAFNKHHVPAGQPCPVHYPGLCKADIPGKFLRDLDGDLSVYGVSIPYFNRFKRQACFPGSQHGYLHRSTGPSGQRYPVRGTRPG